MILNIAFYIIISLLIIVIIILIVLLSILLYKERKTKKLEIENKNLNNEILKENLIILKENINSTSLKQTNELFNFQKSLNENLNSINERINQKILEGFEKNQSTSKELMENIGKLTEKSEQLKQYNLSIDKLINILNNNKLRGKLGEYQLESILNAISGDNNLLYKKQYMLSNKTIADAIIHAPKPIGNICIDSKFPLSNFINLVENENEKEKYKKLFKADVKKHINDINSKYIILDETSENAIMFIPAEYIYLYINNNCPDLIDYAISKNIWITSPSTLISTLTMINTILMNIERDKFSQTIKKDLEKLAIEFERYTERTENVYKTFEKLISTFNELKITSNKISNKFNDIKNLKNDTNTKGE